MGCVPAVRSRVFYDSFISQNVPTESNIRSDIHVRAFGFTVEQLFPFTTPTVVAVFGTGKEGLELYAGMLGMEVGEIRDLSDEKSSAVVSEEIVQELVNNPSSICWNWRP